MAGSKSKNGGRVETREIDQDLIYDEVTGLHSYLQYIHDLEAILQGNHALGALYIDLSYLNKIEEKFGTSTYNEVLKSIGKVIDEMRGSIVRQTDLILLSEVGNPSPIIFLSETRKERDNFMSRANVEVVSDRVQEFLLSKLFFLVYPYIKERPKISVGYSFVVNNPLIAPKRLVYSLIDDAKNIARLQRSRLEIKDKERLQQIILHEQIQTLYQPIVNLQTMEIIGYEALSRGPANSEYETPIMLFALARETGLLFELDRVCRKKALQSARHLPADKHVFVNTLPNTIHDPEFRGKYLKDFLHDLSISPGNIVFEITEGAAVENYGLFREAVNYYTDMGIAVAIDDMGTGYSTLELIIEINPQFLKFDISMVKNIDKSLLKRELLKALIAVAKQIDAVVIAEGIETKAELDTLVELGVHMGQGFLFSRPGPAFPDISRIEKII